MPDAKFFFPIFALFAASAMLIRSIAKKNTFAHMIRNLSCHFSSQLTLVIEEFYYEALFRAVDTYLGMKPTASAQRLKAVKKEDEKKLAIMMDRNEETSDVFEDIQVRWKLTSIDYPEVRLRCYELTFNKKHKEKVLNSYLPYILERKEVTEEKNKKRKINMLNGMTWVSSIEFDHPMTFSTISMDSEVKQALIDDLNTFMNAKEYYRRIGKARKRTYLIYGPPRTGKSSLIAAMANHLNYKIYDVDLSNIQEGEDIRGLLLHHITRSVLVIKDFDSPVKQRRYETEAKQVTEVQKQALLLKLLRVIDGLWLPRGNELIIVIKADGREKLDPQLLLPGRIDMQIPTTYCTVSTFEQFVCNYFGILFSKVPEEIEMLLQKVQITPAEVAREITRSSDYDDFQKRLCQIPSQENGEK